MVRTSSTFSCLYSHCIADLCILSIFFPLPYSVFCLTRAAIFFCSSTCSPSFPFPLRTLNPLEQESDWLISGGRLGAGTVVGSAIAGKLMTQEFLRSEQIYKQTHPDLSAGSSPVKNKKNLPLDFPIEHARLRHVPWITALFVTSTAFYGFTLLPVTQSPLVSRPGWIAVPLALQFVIASTSNAVFAINTALVADLCPGQGASATAINNLVRCTIGAAGVAGIDGMLSTFGPAATFLGLAFLSIAMATLLAVEWTWGMQWRGERERRRAKDLT